MPEIERSPFKAYLNSLSSSSRPTMTHALNQIAQFFGGVSVSAVTFVWHSIRYEDSQCLRDYLVQKYRSRTVNKHLAALRGVLKAAWRLELMSTDAYHHARDVKVVKINEPPAGRRLGLDELRKLVLEADDKRDAALVAILYAAGLRRFEVVRLRVSDYDRDTGCLTVRGKRNKVRQVTINTSWRTPIVVWLDEYQAASGAAPLFPSRFSGRKDKLRRLSANGVTMILEAVRERVGVAPFTSHDMRRTLITNLIASGADLVVVQRIAGHEHVNTTASYDRRGRDAEDSAIERLKGLTD